MIERTKLRPGTQTRSTPRARARNGFILASVLLAASLDTAGQAARTPSKSEIVAAREIGRETVDYVSNIYKYYTTYVAVAEQRSRRGQGPQKKT